MGKQTKYFSSYSDQELIITKAFEDIGIKRLASCCLSQIPMEKHFSVLGLVKK